MITIIEEKQDTLNKLCAKYRIKRLELFGSAASDENFSIGPSDLDFLVEFLPLEGGGYFDAYFGFLEELQDLFEKHIDLVTINSIKNPYFLQSVNKSRKLLYAA
ncbi:MAG: nucleotidyltransferase domain-containing protein [Candidatus Desulfatibia sp.]|uniref:nucleotidyltransferase family protein n=1 Tax=Candidatus Desulfatibia sp. TaxID=3101189 RepID=UPI002F326D2D